MKKKIVYLIPAFFLLFVSAYILVIGWIAAMETYNSKQYFIIFWLSILLNFFYYLWLALTKRIDHKLVIIYIPVAVILFIVFVFSIVRPPWSRQVRFDMGPDPSSASSTITGYGTFSIWEKEFWSESAREEYRLIQLKRVETAIQSSLIGD